MSTDPYIGRNVAGHRVLSVIGRGGMSVVYLAEHQGLERHVALKILGPELAEDEAFRERFIRESSVAAELDHPNVVTVYDAGEVDGVLYLSMRYLEGSDLERLLRSETQLAPATTADLIQQCAAGLDAAHARGLVHRDVKPGNVLLASDDGRYRAYLSDFGVTKRIHTGASLTRSGQFVGTVDYVAPEQIRSDEVDARADVYSLACVAFRCLTGDVPFPRDTEVATIYAQLQDPPPVASERRPGVPAGFDAPIVRALAKDRDDRFASCGAFAAAVAAAVPVSTTAPAAAGPAPPPVVQAGTTRPVDPRRRRRGPLIGGAVAILAVAVVAAYVSWWPRDGGGTTEESPSPPPPPPALAWSGTVLPTAAGSGGATAVVAAAGTAIAAGWIEPEGDRNAAVWRQTEGRWRRVPDPEFGGAATQSIASLGTDGDLVIAVGSEAVRGDADAAVWRSADGGSTWSRIDPVTGGLHRPADQAMLAVVHGPEGWIAAGWDRSGGDQDAAVWISDDGQTWTRQGGDALGGDGRQAIAALTIAGERTVAAGWTSGPDGDLDGAVWLRSGGGWSRATGDAALGGAGDQRAWAVAADAETIAAAGDETTAGEPRPAVWTSGDGDRWERAAGDGLGGAGSVHALVGLDGAWIAAGSSAGGVAAVWRSADGSSWPDGPEDVGRPDGAAIGPGGAVAAIADPGGRRLVAAGLVGAGAPVAWVAVVS